MTISKAASTGGRPRHALHPLRVLTLFALTFAAGCGGNGEDETVSALVRDDTKAETVSSVEVSVYPALPGMVLIEEDAGGAELRRSMATDDGGRAAFDEAIEGPRLRSADKADPWRLPLRRSARLLGEATVIELTPLTTIFDQFVDEGMQEPVAQARVRSLIESRCGVTPDLVPNEAVYGDRPLAGPVREWLLAALGAYVDAFGKLGLGPDTPGIDWAGLLDANAPLLARLCATAQSVYSTEWLDTTTRTIAARGKLSEAAAQSDAQSIRPQALAQVLALQSSHVAVQQQPQLKDLLEPQVRAWRIDMPELVVELAAAVTQRATAGIASGNLGVRLDGDGQIVHVIGGQTYWTDSTSPALRFVNRGDQDRSVRLEINGATLDSVADLVREVLAMPAEQADEALHRRAWRYVVQRSEHSWPVSEGNFQHQPELFLRSVGRGFCDDVAQTLALMWQAMGYETRVAWLSGHVVPEVFVEGRWELYDPDYRVYYLDRQGQVASVADIESDRTLMTSPLLRMAGAADGAYSDSLADIYSSTDDNYVNEPQAYTPSSLFESTIDLPASATLELRGAGAIAVPTIDSDTSIKAASLSLQLPPGFTGIVRLPYVLTDIMGDGRVAWIGGVTDIPPQGLATVIANRNRNTPSIGITSVDVQQVGPRGLTLTMMVNPSLATSGPLRAALKGASVDGIEVGAAPL